MCLRVTNKKNRNSKKPCCVIRAMILVGALFGTFAIFAEASVAQAQVQPAAPPKTTSAAGIEIECPEEVKTRQAPAQQVAGWLTHVETVSRQIFAGLDVYDGHPKDGVGAALLPEEAGEPTGGTAVEEVGTLYKLPQDRESYVVCKYSNTQVRLLKKLPKGTKTCRIRFSQTLGHIQKALCD